LAVLTSRSGNHTSTSAVHTHPSDTSSAGAVQPTPGLGGLVTIIVLDPDGPPSDDSDDSDSRKPPLSPPPTPPAKSCKFWFAVRRGRVTGVFESYADVHKSVVGFPDAEWQVFKTYEEALNYLEFSTLGHQQELIDHYKRLSGGAPLPGVSILKRPPTDELQGVART